MVAVPSHVEYESTNPSHHPDWRWRRAQKLFEEKSPFNPSSDDEPVRRALLYLNVVAESADPFEASPSYDAHADVHHARCIAGGERSLPHLIDTYLLSGLSNEEIASRLGTHPAVIGTYEALFYCVRHRVADWGWLISTLFGDDLRNGFSAEELGQVSKLVACFGGPKLLEVVLAITQGRPLPAWVLPRGNQDPVRYRFQVGKAVIEVIKAMGLPVEERLQRLARLGKLPQQPERGLWEKPKATSTDLKCDILKALTALLTDATRAACENKPLS